MVCISNNINQLIQHHKTAWLHTCVSITIEIATSHAKAVLIPEGTLAVQKQSHITFVVVPLGRIRRGKVMRRFGTLRDHRASYRKLHNLSYYVRSLFLFYTTGAALKHARTLSAPPSFPPDLTQLGLL
jgi:hypothetical protein